MVRLYRKLSHVNDAAELRRKSSAPRASRQKRRRKLLRVAERVFLTAGSPIRRCKSSRRKPALRKKRFTALGSKEGLFFEVIRSRSVRNHRRNEGELSVEGSPREILGDLGLNLLRFLVILIRSRFTAHCHRSAAGTGARRIFYAQGPPGS